ncbi:DMT family transporter [Ferruginivarius sediminum]|uniref:EamA family transporter n=1 Tax=Ferruginivarius sediminum TaxID=2661937 RepID=A0A369T7J4_9PROT|nr:EamA family transporter [Ferruginivarius sediminum]RDD61280.1 EamA family transporter [Ferruginivarius sediminum]
MQFSVKPLHLLLFVAVTVVWGGNFAVTKLGLLEIPPIMLVAMRFALVTVILLPFAGIPRGKLPAIGLLSVVLGLLHFSMMFTGLKDIDAATAAISIQLQVPFAALLAALAFGERLGWRRALGMAIAFAGVAVIAGEPRLEGSYLSLALVIGAAMVWSVANILVKRLGEVDGTQINAWMALFATPQLAAASFVLEDGQWAAWQAADWRTLLIVAYQAVLVVALGYGTWYAMLKRYDVNVAMPFTLLVPFFGVLSGVLFLDEVLTAALIVGGAMTIVGVGIIVIRRPRLAGPKIERY